MFPTQEIKSRITCLEYAKQNGISVNHRSGRCASPFRPSSDNKTVFVIRDDFWYDFKTGEGGDVIDFAANLKHNGDRGAAIRELSEDLGIQCDSMNFIKARDHMEREVLKWHSKLEPKHVEYLKSRKITESTIKDLKIGFSPEMNRIVVPYWKNKRIYSWVARAWGDNMSPKYLKPTNNNNTEFTPWGVHTLSNGSDMLIIAEGTFDALSFAQESFCVLSPMGGFFGKEAEKFMMSASKQFKYVVVCFDSDGAGKGFSYKIANKLFENKIPFKVATVPNPFKDVSEYYSSGGSLKDLISSSEDGTDFLCKSMDSREDFEKFVYKAARFVSKPVMAELFETAKSIIDTSSEWFKTVQKQALSAPSENIIAQEISDDHQLIYSEAEGFHEYENDIWRSKTDTEIAAYVSEALGPWRSGNKISSILKLVKVDSVSDQVFNRNNVFCFRNGTLELGSMKFRESRSSDFCSIQLPYTYQADADCPNWKKFIEDVTGDDESRKSFLQELVGYVLYNDCSLQVAFFLMGDGSNGKSVFLDVITKLFSPENVSNITLSSLKEPFQLINLKNALVNISSENKPDLREVSEIFKSVVAGDRVTACYKGRDFVDFNPRAKHIFAGNSMFFSRDSSYGLERRIEFVKFPFKFVSNPDPEIPNQKQKDPDLRDRLLEELPGIFNWAVSGYKRLKSQKKFTKTTDKDELMAEFKEATCPIYVFMTEANPFENNYKPELSNSEFYQLYRDWCYSSGHAPKNQTGFIREVKQVLPDNIVEFRTARKRGFKMVSK